ncbi:hypothetical protein [Desulfitobacterium sp.]|uniref:hypothetical protein n=1 Tax=Desulfitobacterium sp. TaxID=49981 RepID=UPI002BBCC0F4|nr:hypothetical protein [Desulfitobacterium sp.]HVJ49387.1 hypothetical protein [Desulfitobacterium sp.]
MNDYYAKRVNEQNEDLKSIRVRDDLKINLTNKAFISLKSLAYKAGFESAEELLSSFIGDLTGWGYTNGSDERDYADRWYERAFGSSDYYTNFRYYLFNNGLSLEDMADMLDDEDYFEDVYQSYIDENEGKTNQSKDDCLALVKKILEKGEEL